MPQLSAAGSDGFARPHADSLQRKRGFGEWREVGRHLQGKGTVLSPPRVGEGLPRGWDPPRCRARVPQPCRSPSPPFVPAASAGLLENCTGCVLCSEDNGCITCHHRLFLLIWRDGIRQYGMCVHTCPPGYFGVRGLEVNRCTSTSRDSQGPPPSSSRCPQVRPLAAPPWEGRWLRFPRHPRRHRAGGSRAVGLLPLFPCPELQPGPCRFAKGFGSPAGTGATSSGLATCRPSGSPN